MCRLYGFLSTEPTRLECSLVEAHNALQVQSDRDSRGVRNADGWGIAHREGLRAVVIKSTDPAFADRRFSEAATRVSSDAVIAHIRAATVGGVAERNTHPFTHGPWSFAHNGTIAGIEHVATHLDLGRFGPPDGETDSELAFLWMLNRMADYGLDPEAPAENLGSLVDLVADAVLELVRITIRTGASETPKLNFLLSDGRHMVASRWGHTLFWTFRRGLRDCAVCGTSHCPAADETYRAVVIASEPITADEDWTELPEGSVPGVAPNAHTMRRDLLAAAHR